MAQLTILYDGGCPLCVREVRFLEQRDRRLHPQAPRLAFVDIDAADYQPAAHGGIGYREAMGRIHALEATGDVVKDVDVFRRAYQLIGLGWLYAPTGWPLLAPLVNALYAFWASVRLRITGRPSLEQLCSVRGGHCGVAPSRPHAAAAGVAVPAGSAGWNPSRPR
jgi:predicted DCC family thiol-disulfide oxidoreductase YuxK